jgi:hypothetical protein
MTTRQRCRRIINSICLKESGLSLDDLPDLPCIMHALDEMVSYIEAEGEVALVSELYNIAQDAVFELLEEEGMLLD